TASAEPAAAIGRREVRLREDLPARHAGRIMILRTTLLWLVAATAGFAAAPANPPAPPAEAAPGPALPPHELTAVWEPVPPVVAAPADQPPSDAIVLFDGTNLDAWESAKTPGSPAPWTIQDGLLAVMPKSG